MDYLIRFIVSKRNEWQPPERDSFSSGAADRWKFAEHSIESRISGPSGGREYSPAMAKNQSYSAYRSAIHAI
jgi:hypothetical protein